MAASIFAIVFGAIGTSAFAAQSATTSQYSDSLVGAENSAGSNDGGGSGGQSAGGGTDPGGSSGSGQIGSLPFTGADLVAFTAIAVFLLATGALLMQLSRPRRN